MCPHADVEVAQNSVRPVLMYGIRKTDEKWFFISENQASNHLSSTFSIPQKLVGFWRTELVYGVGMWAIRKESFSVQLRPLLLCQRQTTRGIPPYVRLSWPGCRHADRKSCAKTAEPTTTKEGGVN